ncbi:MAG: hypothetical protein EP298_11145 [Gammaproteobacteria bacterium]|nr:MAG: hypothetical protein EP298_11145 [Gammaproteobacteria bacterium]UTW43176.1 hypothetical protein KFE69_03245 [bacterium SCSIO 12844]
MTNWNKKVSLQLGGSLNPSFIKASESVVKNLDVLGRKELKLKQNKALIGKLQADQMAINKTNASYKKQVLELKALQRAYSSASKDDQKLAQRISKKQQQVNKTNAKLNEQRKGLKLLGTSLKKAGIDTANLTSEEKRLQRALEKTQKQAKLKSKTFSALGSGLSKVKYAALGATAAIGAMGASAFASVSSFSNHGDNVAKVADKLGISTDTLQKLRYAAERTGVTTQTLDMAMQRMSRRLSEAANGSGEAKGALEELGLSAVELNNMKPDQALALIADRLDQVTNQKDRMRLAMKFFDSEGVALVNTLKGGSKALTQYAKDAERVGYVLNEKSLRAAENNRDAYLNMKTSIQGVAYALGDSLMPAFTQSFNNITVWISENKLQITEWAETAKVIFSTVGTVIKGVASVISFVFKSAWRFGEYLGIAVYDTVEGIKSAFTALKNIGQSVVDFFSKVISFIVDQFKTVTEKIDWVKDRAKTVASYLSFGYFGNDETEVKVKPKLEPIQGNELNFANYNPINVEDFSKVRKQVQQVNQQTQNSKVNHVTITNQVTVQGNGDKLTLMQGVEEATQKALYDYQVGGV